MVYGETSAKTCEICMEDIIFSEHQINQKIYQVIITIDNSQKEGPENIWIWKKL